MNIENTIVNHRTKIENEIEKQKELYLDLEFELQTILLDQLIQQIELDFN